VGGIISLSEAIARWEITASGSSTANLWERPFYPLPISLQLLISRRLRLGTGQRFKDPQPRQREQIIEMVDAKAKGREIRTQVEAHGSPAT
jgi:hypothetical protein